MIEQVVGQILALAGLTVAGLLVNRFIHIELTLSCLLVGFLAGLGLGYVEFDTGIRAYNLQQLVFFVILPVLIFEAAWHLRADLLKRWLLPILLMATLGVLIGTVLTAALLYLGIGHPQGFPWIAALLAGAILSATDPVAVISKLRQAKASEDLTTLFEGESLFNDASVVVIFSIILAIATRSGATEGSYLAFFSLVFFGGVLFGLVAGLVTTVVILLLQSSIASRLVVVFSAFATFYLAEHLLHVSGIMALLVAALITRILLREVEDTVAQGIAETWEWLGLFLNSILFVILGLVITVGMFQEQWLSMLIAIGASLIARTVAVVTMALPARWLQDKSIPWGWQALLVWGGLRGAIAIALVLSLPTSLPYWWVIQSMVFGVVLFSLLVQGSTISPLIGKWGKAE